MSLRSAGPVSRAGTSWRWTVRLSLLVSAGCLAVWVCSRFAAPQTVGDFLEGGRPVALARGFLYVNLSRPPTPAEQELARQMDDLERRAYRREVPRITTFSGHRSQGSGDQWIVFGWEVRESTRQVGPLSGTFDRRRGLWVSPWAGVLAGLVPWAITASVRAARRRKLRRRAAAGQCLACGYDLRSTPGRCPECGRVPTAA